MGPANNGSTVADVLGDIDVVELVGSEWPPVIWCSVKLLSVVWAIEGVSMVSILLLMLRDICCVDFYGLVGIDPAINGASK